jgi:hypothetical protein
MADEGLLFRLTATGSTEDDVARALEDGPPVGLADLPLTAWYAVRFDMTRFGVLVAFRDRDGQEAHVGDRVASWLRDDLAPLLGAPPEVEGFDVLTATGAPAAR